MSYVTDKYPCQIQVFTINNTLIELIDTSDWTDKDFKHLKDKYITKNIIMYGKYRGLPYTGKKCNYYVNREIYPHIDLI